MSGTNCCGRCAASSTRIGSNLSPRIKRLKAIIDNLDPPAAQVEPFPGSEVAGGAEPRAEKAAEIKTP
jgi:hypothetical protein